MEKAELEELLKILNEKILEVQQRMPSHSVKPAIMTELFELEDEKETIISKLQKLSE